MVILDLSVAILKYMASTIRKTLYDAIWQGGWIIINI